MNQGEILRLAALGITLSWMAWVLVWIVAAFRTKRVVYRESLGTRFLYLLPIILSAVLLLMSRTSRLGRMALAEGSYFGWLYVRFIRLFPGAVWIGVPLVLLGLAITFWARFHLAGNWSGSVTLKENHELVRSVPIVLRAIPSIRERLLRSLAPLLPLGRFAVLSPSSLRSLAFGSRAGEKRN